MDGFEPWQKLKTEQAAECESQLALAVRIDVVFLELRHYLGKPFLKGIQMNVPMDELRSGTELDVLTSRLQVRLTEEVDVEALVKLLRDHRVSSQSIDPIDVDDWNASAFFVREFTAWKNQPRLHFTALRRIEGTGENTVVGAAQLFDGEISYCIDPAFWYQGYGYELVSAVCHIARDRLGLDRLFAKVLRDNLRSRRILERLGFLFCGLEYLPHAFYPGRFAVLHLIFGAEPSP